jgi:hypothetical protein
MEKVVSILLHKKLRSLYQRSAAFVLVQPSGPEALVLEREVQRVLQLAVASDSLQAGWLSQRRRSGDHTRGRR